MKTIGIDSAGLLEVVNGKLQVMHDLINTGEETTNDYRKPFLISSFLNYDTKLTDNASGQDMMRNFKTFNSESKIIPFRRERRADTGQFVYAFAVNNGGYREASSTIQCSTVDPSCDSSSSDCCPDLKPYTQAGGSLLGYIDLKKEYYANELCLTDAEQIENIRLYTDVYEEQTGVKTKGENYAQTLVGDTMRAVQNAMIRRDIIDMFSDNGVVATVISTTPVPADGTAAVKLDRTELLIGSEHMNYAVFRPNPSQTGVNDCTPFCERETQFLGIIQQVDIPEMYTREVVFDRAFEIKTGTTQNQLPLITLQQGDYIVALTGEVLTVTLGGTTYKIDKPYPGVATGQIAPGFALPQVCCNNNGYYGILTLDSGISAGTVTEYMGLPISGRYNKLLDPIVYNDCCASAEGNGVVVTRRNLEDWIKRVVARVDVMRAAGWRKEFHAYEIVIDIAPDTYRTTLEAIDQFYLTTLGYEKHVNTNNSGNIDITMLDKDRIRLNGKVMNEKGEIVLYNDFHGYKVVIRQVSGGEIPEGVIRMGLRNPYFWAVAENLQGENARYNRGQLVKMLPKPFEQMPLEGSRLNELRNSYTYMMEDCGVVKTYLSYRVSRLRSRYHIAPGTELIVRNVIYRDVDSCGITCGEYKCEGEC